MITARQLRNRFMLSLVTPLVIFIGGCKKSDDKVTHQAKPEKELVDFDGPSRSYRVQSIHLYSDTVYVLNEFFERFSGEQLIIDKGTLIKCGSSITIYPGGVIISDGTPDMPVVFTRNTNIESVATSNWQGLVIHGKAGNNDKGPITEDSTDYSGSLKYTRIEFAALTLDGVGTRTTIENVMISYTDSFFQLRPQCAFNILGGTFEAKNLVSYACAGPADFYISRGYRGKLQNLLAYRHPILGRSGDQPQNTVSGIFIENSPTNPSGAEPLTNPVISNLTVIGPNGQPGSPPAYTDSSSGFRSAALVSTGNAFFHIRNSVFMGFPLTAWYLDDALTGAHILDSSSGIVSSLFQSSTDSRVFYLDPAADPPFTSADFKYYVLNHPSYKDSLVTGAADFGFEDPFNYENPSLVPLKNSPVWGHADFNDPLFKDPFFSVTDYAGAFGNTNWLAGWTNFIPFRTNYNFFE